MSPFFVAADFGNNLSELEGPATRQIPKMKNSKKLKSALMMMMMMMMMM